MTRPTSGLRARLIPCLALGVAATILMESPEIVDAQGLVEGVQKGAREGNKAAGPVGGVLGGAIGGVVGVVTGVTGVLTGKTGQQTPAASDAKKDSAKTAKTPKGAKIAKQAPAVLTQEGAPTLT